jgi:hypothetical protein
MKFINKYFNIGCLYVVGIITALALGIWTFLTGPGLALAIWAIAFWLSFNLSVGSVIGLQISIVQSLTFVLLIRVLRSVISIESPTI